MENTFRPDFLLIPYQVAFDDKLNSLDGKVYAIVYWLSKMAIGKCTASNEFLAELTKSKVDSVSHSLMRLEKQKYIKRIFQEGNKDVRLEIVPLVSFLIGSSIDRPGGSSIDRQSKSKAVKSNLLSKDNKSSHKEIFEYFKTSVETKCGYAPTFNGGKDGKAVKLALSKFDSKEVKKIIDFYLHDSEKVEKFGYNLSTALSANTINIYLYKVKRY